MSSPLAPIAAGLLDAFAPLDRALHDPHAFRVLLRNLGWEKEFEDDVLARAAPRRPGRGLRRAALLGRGDRGLDSATAPRTTTRCSRSCST